MTMIMIDKAVVEQALAALVRSEVMHGQPNFDIQDKLREALAQPQPAQEPVAWYDGKNFYENPESASMCMAEMTNLHPLYTSPQAAQPLSDDKLEQIEAVVKELTETLEDLADYAGAFSVSGVYLVEDKHARALLAQAYKLVLKYER